jgi:hypothetical protein
MLKRLFLLWIFSGSLDGFSQVPDTTIPLSEYNWSQPKPSIYTYPSHTPDTLRAELLVTYTTRRWGVAHARDGYVVRKDGKVIRFLDDRKQRFPPNTRLWGWVVNEEKVRP